MQAIGKIKLVQVQRQGLKRAENTPQAHYYPDPLLKVEQMLLTQSGVIGILEDGTNILDVHNPRHAFARRGGGISVGFTSHYATMRQHFNNPKLWDGVAGENIIIESDYAFPAENLGERVAIQSGGQTHFFRVEKVVAPCTEFSKYCRQQDDLPPDVLKETLQFSHQGRRGYFIQPEEGELLVQAGDTFLAEVL